MSLLGVAKSVRTCTSCGKPCERTSILTAFLAPRDPENSSRNWCMSDFFCNTVVIVPMCHAACISTAALVLLPADTDSLDRPEFQNFSAGALGQTAGCAPSGNWCCLYLHGGIILHCLTISRPRMLVNPISHDLDYSSSACCAQPVMAPSAFQRTCLVHLLERSQRVVCFMMSVNISAEQHCPEAPMPCSDHAMRLSTMRR